MYGRTDLPDRGRHSRANRPVETGYIVSTDAVGDEDEPLVRVETRTNRVSDAHVLHDVSQDTGVPAEGTKVYVLRRDDNVPLVIGVAANEHDGYEKQRRFAHPYSDAELTFTEDGGIHIDADDDTEISVDGDVNIDASGDVYIQDIHFEEHTHDYSWTDSGGSDTTDGPQ